jgi:hypothetical protein
MGVTDAGIGFAFVICRKKAKRLQGVAFRIPFLNLLCGVDASTLAVAPPTELLTRQALGRIQTLMLKR